MIPLRKGTKVPAVPHATFEAASMWDGNVDQFLAGGNRVGVMMGDNLVALDADLKMSYADGEDGSQVMTLRNGEDDISGLMAAAGLGSLPRTLKIRTQGGGLHLVFRQNPSLRITQRTIGCLDVRAARNSYIAIGDGYEVIDDGGGTLAEMPEQLARAIMTSAFVPSSGKDGPGTAESGDWITGGTYGNFQTAYNNMLTSAKGFFLRMGVPEKLADDWIRHMNATSPDPIPDGKLDSTVLDRKSWESGEMIPDEAFGWLRQVGAEGQVNPAIADSVFMPWLDTPEYQRIAFQMAFRHWWNTKLKDMPAEADTASWDEVDIDVLLGEKAESAVRPGTLTRADGTALCYEGAVHWIWGEPGHGKTVLCLQWAAQEIKAGRHVIWIDLESQAQATMEKLLTIFSCRRDEVRALFHLIQPDSAFGPEARARFLEHLNRLSPSLVVLDAVNDLITLQGGKHNDVEPISIIDQHLLQPCKQRGAAVAVIDHVAKNAESRGWPINSGHKKAVTEVGFQVRNVAPFTRTLAGYSKITCHKDRNGTWSNEEIVGHLVVANGIAELVAEPTLGVMSGAAALVEQEMISTRAKRTEITAGPDAEREGAIIEAVTANPGWHTVASISAMLADERRGFSASSYRRHVIKMVETGGLVQDDDWKLSMPSPADY